MKKLLLTLGILLLTSPVFAGTTSSNGYFYLPSLGASGASERTTWVNTQEATDAVIQANVNARHSAVTKAGTGTYISLSGQQITADQIDMSTDVDNFASSVLAARLTNETGTGAVVFGTSPSIASPTFTGTIATPLTANRCVQTDGSGNLQAASGSCSLAAPGTDVIGVDQLDDGTDTATIDDVVMIDNADTTQFIYIDVPDCDVSGNALNYDTTGQAFSCRTLADADIPDTITIDLAATATALAADPTDCGANQFATTIAASGNLTCASIVDADVPDSITVSNYLLLTGGTLTGEVTVDDLGLEFTEGDTLTDCSTFAATGGGIFYDDSEGKLKKCQDNVLTDLDTTGGAEVNNLESDGAADIADTEIFIGTGAGTGNYAAVSGDATLANTGALTVSDDSHNHTTTTVSGLDISDDTNLTAGRSLTLTGDDVAADAELFTDSQGAWIDLPVVEEIDEIYFFMTAATVTRVHCYTDAGTVTLNVENAADADILSADIVCDVGGQSSCASGCDVNTINLANDNFAAFAEGDISISATASSPTKVSVFLGYTLDD